MPPAAADIFGERLALAESFAGLLAGTGVTHGLIGPREVPRLWERHILNCAVLAEAMTEHGSTVLDLGSGAGLPGIAVAIARPDLRLRLLEPMLRRTTWLQGCVDELGLDNVEVLRGRAQEYAGRLRVRYVTARAVARLDVLLGWAAPLTEIGGEILALKGGGADEEITQARPVLTGLGLGLPRIDVIGAAVLREPTTVVVVPKESDPVAGPAVQHGRRPAKRARDARGGTRGHQASPSAGRHGDKA